MQVWNRKALGVSLGIFLVLPFIVQADAEIETAAESSSWFCLRYDDAEHAHGPLKKLREVAERASAKYICDENEAPTDVVSSTAVQKATEKGIAIKTELKASFKSRFTAFLIGLFPKAAEMAKNLIKP